MSTEQSSKRVKLASAVIALGLVAAACGTGDDGDDLAAANATDDEAAQSADDAMEDDAMEDDAMEDDAMEEEDAMEETTPWRRTTPWRGTPWPRSTP